MNTLSLNEHKFQQSGVGAQSKFGISSYFIDMKRYQITEYSQNILL